MARDALQLLLSIRQRSVDEAHQALTLCLKAEAGVQDKISALDEAARRDHLAARNSAERVPFLDMFVARLHQTQAERRTLKLALATGPRLDRPRREPPWRPREKPPKPSKPCSRSARQPPRFKWSRKPSMAWMISPGRNTPGITRM